jgi:hypothetical protein
LIRNFRLDQSRQQRQRLLPAEVARFCGNNSRHAFLHDVQFCSARNFFERDRRLHFARQVRVVKFIRVANAFVRPQLHVCSAEGVALARGEIRKGHSVSAVDLGVHLVHLAGESVWRKPFGQGVGIKKCPINFLRRRTEHTVKSNRVCVLCWDKFRYVLILLLRWCDRDHPADAEPVFEHAESRRPKGFRQRHCYLTAVAQCVERAVRFSFVWDRE